MDPSRLFQRPDWARRVIAMGDAAGGAERLVPLDVDLLCASAIAASGLGDFGDCDGDWLGRLRRLVEAIDRTARMHALGRLMTRAEILRGLGTRLALANLWRQHPAIADEVVRAPVVITGPARSGTSLLFELLDLDPGLRGPRGWEIAYPGPASESEQEDRIRRSEFEYEFWADVQPEFRAVHDLRSVYPQECIHLQLPSFSGAFWSMIANIPGWTPDMGAAMRFHRALLKTLQHGAERRTWVLKTPVYLAMLDLLFATYPDAWVIHSHRDPVKTAASGASTLATVRWLRSDHVEAKGIAGSDGMGTLLLALMERRAKGELPDRIVDVHFMDLMADPVGTVEAAYARISRDLCGAHADAIRRYVDDRPKGTFGTHAYTPEQWGFDERALRERMRPYTDYYGIRLE